MDADTTLPVEMGPTPGNGEAAQETPETDPGALLQQKDSEIAALQEQVKRMAAEFENFRRRQEADRLRRLDGMKDDLFRSLLPVVDHLERAASAARAGADVDALVQGIDLVLRDAHRILEGHGVKPVEAVGQAFDPALHEAVLTEEREDVPDETVVQELQRGYRIAERLLRASMVKVARNPAGSPSADPEGQD